VRDAAAKENDIERMQAWQKQFPLERSFVACGKMLKHYSDSVGAALFGSICSQSRSQLVQHDLTAALLVFLS